MNDKKRLLWVIISALAQGFFLAAYIVAKYEFISYMPVTLILLIPFAFWLTQEHWGKRLNNFLLGLSCVLIIFYLYRLWSLYTPAGIFYFANSQHADLIRVSMAVFFLMPFFQCRIVSWSWNIPYSDIFFQFCRNLFLLFQAAIVIAVFWGMLITAGLLFEIVGLEKVPAVILSPFVSVPLTSLIIAISISVAIRHPGIDSLGRWILSVLAWLLPFFSFMSVIFLACLPFSGLKMLWDTGQASTLMLLLQFGTIILANAAWLDGSKKIFTNKYINFFAQLALLTLPVYTVLCVYSVGLRISQYGLSVDRVQAMFLVVVTGIWGLCYAGAVLLKKWPYAIGRVNMASISIMAVIVAAMNSPLLDPYSLAASNQVSRLSAGKISPENFDYLYARFNLGRYGNNMLQELRKSKSISYLVKKGIDRAYSVEPDEYIENASVYPHDMKLNESFVKFFIDYWEDHKSILRNIDRANEIAFIKINIEQGADNIIALADDMAMIFNISGDVIKQTGEISGSFDPKNITSSDIKLLTPSFMDLQINGNTYRVTPVK